MARTKKQSIEPIVDINSDTNVDTSSKTDANTSTESISYTGTIQVIIKKNKQVIFKQKYNNHGTSKLFRFLSSCLTLKDPALLRQEAPYYIQLFSLKNPSYDGINFITTVDSTPISGAFPVVETTVDGSDRAHLSFTIPGTNIIESLIYQAGLYSQNFREDIANYSAAFNFKEGDSWAPIAINAQSADYVISIDWTMSFTNK